MTIKVNGTAVLTLLAGAGMAALAFIGWKADKEEKERFEARKKEVFEENDISEQQKTAEEANESLEVDDRIKLKRVLAVKRHAVYQANRIKSLNEAIDIWKEFIEATSTPDTNTNLVTIRYEYEKLEDARKEREALANRIAEKEKYTEIANGIRSLGYSLGGRNDSGFSISV